MGWNVNDFVILTSQAQGFAANVLPTLANLGKARLVGVIYVEGANPSTKWRTRRRKLAKIARIGPAGALNGRRMRDWYQLPGRPLREVCNELGVPLHTVPFVGSDETQRVLRDLSPELMVSLGNGFIPARVFRLPRLGTINLHTERLPDYQNAQGVIWPIYNMEKITGYTIHMVAAKIDAGDILFSETIPIIFGRTLKETVRLTTRSVFASAAEGLAQVLENYDQTSRRRQPQGAGRMYTTPSGRQFRQILVNHTQLAAQADNTFSARPEP